MFLLGVPLEADIKEACDQPAHSIRGTMLMSGGPASRR